MRFEVPQFVEIEDKIVGPFTWKQFIYLAGGAGALFILYIYLPFFLFLIVGLPFGALAAGLAFYEVNNRPLSVLLESMTLYFGHSRLYLWKKAASQRTTPSESAASAPVPSVNLSGKNNITSLARRLEMNALDKK